MCGGGDNGIGIVIDDIDFAFLSLGGDFERESIKILTEKHEKTKNTKIGKLHDWMVFYMATSDPKEECGLRVKKNYKQHFLFVCFSILSMDILILFSY